MSQFLEVKKGDMVTISGKKIDGVFIIENIVSDDKYYFIFVYNILDTDSGLILYGSDNDWKIYGLYTKKDDEIIEQKEKILEFEGEYIIKFFDKKDIPNYKYFFTFGFPSGSNNPSELDKNWLYIEYISYPYKSLYVVIKGKKPKGGNYV